MFQDADGSCSAVGSRPLRSGTSALCGRLPPDWEALSQAHGLRHFVAVPLSCGHSLVGVLTLASRQGATLSEHSPAVIPYAFASFYVYPKGCRVFLFWGATPFRLRVLSGNACPRRTGDQPPAAWAGGCLAAAAGLLLGSLLLPRQLPIATAALADIGAARNVDEVVRALRRAVSELVVATTYLQPAVRVALIRAVRTALASVACWA